MISGFGNPLTPCVEEAIAELKGFVVARYPEATFAIGEGEDPEGVYLTATVDVEEMDEVVDVFLGRLVDYQVEENLPLYVVAIRPLARNTAILARQQELATAAFSLA